MDIVITVGVLDPMKLWQSLADAYCMTKDIEIKIISVERKDETLKEDQ